MTQATAAITDKLKNTFVRTAGFDTTDLQKAFFKLGFKWWLGGREINGDALNASYIRVDSDCEMAYAEFGATPEANQVRGYTEVTVGDVFAYAEQVRKIKREEHKESKKRKAKRNWEATATQKTHEACPVHPEVIVSYKQRNGSVYTTQAKNCNWRTNGCITDIISYKVIGFPPKKPASQIVSVDDMFADIATSLGKGTGIVHHAEEEPPQVDCIQGPFYEATPDTNPKKQYGVSSIPLNMWSPLASAYGALGLYNGSLKYGKANFANTPVEASIYIAAAMRHLLSWACGQEDDPADGVPNLGGVLANIAILLESRAAGMLIDDRLLMSGYLKEIEMLKAKVKALNELHAGKNPKHYTREGQ